MSEVQFQNLVQQCETMSQQMVKVNAENTQLQKEIKLLLTREDIRRKTNDMRSR